ncbi:MAG TPA: acetyltransferase [Halomicronema sp.]
MLLKEKESGDLIKIVDVDALIIPTRKEVEGCIQAGQEEQDPTTFDKNQLVFPSGETLPRCWVDSDYQNS